MKHFINEYVDDQSTLESIVRHYEDRDTQYAALKKLIDKWHTEGSIEKLSNQNLLTNIAESRSYYDMRRLAIRGLTNQAVLEHIAKTDHDEYVRETAVEQITDQRILADIALNPQDPRASVAAGKNLKDKSTLQRFHQLVLTNPNYYKHADEAKKKACLALYGEHDWESRLRMNIVGGCPIGNPIRYKQCKRCGYEVGTYGDGSSV